jgi:hypothetical protein
MELHNSQKWIAIKYIIYIMNYNFATHITCPLAFKVYKYDKFQVVIAIQKLNCKANYTRPLFLIMKKSKLMSTLTWIGEGVNIFFYFIGIASFKGVFNRIVKILIYHAAQYSKCLISRFLEELVLLYPFCSSAIIN